MTPAETLAKAKELDGFLDRSVKEIRTMNKFAETASKVKASLESMNAEADDLSVDADKTMSLFMASVQKYRSLLNEAREGIKAMEEAAAAMAGHNGGPLPDSPPVSPPLPPVIEPPAVEEVKAPEPEPMPPMPVPTMPSPEPEPVMPGPEPGVEPLPAPSPVDPTANGNAPA